MKSRIFNVIINHCYSTNQSKTMSINVNLRPNQLKKAMAGATFQLDKTQLDSRGYELQITHKPTWTRYNKAVRANTGIRFAAGTYAIDDAVEGGRIKWKKIGKKIRSTVNNTGNAAAAAAKQEAARQGRLAAEFAKNEAKQALKDAAVYTIDQGVTAAATGVGTAIGGPGLGLAAGTLASQNSNLLSDPVGRKIDGLGFNGKRAKKLIKGSPEAKQFMANLRNRKTGAVKQVLGGNLKNNLKNAVRNVTDRPVGGSSFGQYQLAKPSILRTRGKSSKPVISAGSFLAY